MDKKRNPIAIPASARHVATIIVILCIGLNLIAITAYLAAFFNWNLPVEKVVYADKLMGPVLPILLAGCAVVILFSMGLNRIGAQFEKAEKWVRKSLKYLALFGLVFFLGTAFCSPHHPLRLNGSRVEVNDGKWTEIKPHAAENIFRQNIRRDMGAFVFAVNLGVSCFIYCLFSDSERIVCESFSHQPDPPRRGSWSYRWHS